MSRRALYLLFTGNLPAWVYLTLLAANVWLLGIGVRTGHATLDSRTNALRRTAEDPVLGIILPIVNSQELPIDPFPQRFRCLLFVQPCNCTEEQVRSIARLVDPRLPLIIIVAGGRSDNKHKVEGKMEHVVLMEDESFRLGRIYNVCFLPRAYLLSPERKLVWSQTQFATSPAETYRLALRAFAYAGRGNDNQIAAHDWRALQRRK